MIAKMKKLRILALGSHKNDVTSRLRELGIVHINTSAVSGGNLDELRDNKSAIENALQVIGEGSTTTSENIDLETGVGYARKILEVQDELAQISDDRAQIKREIARIDGWGNFTSADIEELKNSGVELYPAELSKDRLKKLPEDVDYILVKKGKDINRVVFLTKPDLPNIEPLVLPELSLEELSSQIEKLDKNEAAAKREISSLVDYRGYLVACQAIVAKKIEFAEVEANIREVGEISVLSEIEGYIPAKRTAELTEFASTAGVGYVIEDPSPEDDVPTLTDNPRAVGIVKPVFNFMGTTPGYREQDISFWFLIFFTVFFAMIIGDAGYGSILTLAAIGATVSSKIKHGRVSDGILLFDLLAVSTVVWGAITGNWFGYGPIADIPFLAQFVIPALDSFDVVNSKGVTQSIQYICFVIGLVHLVLAHLLAFIKKIQESPRIHAFADLGWLTTIVGLFFLVLNVVISAEQYPVPDFAMYLIFSGIGVVFIFSGQQGDGFFKGLLRSFSPGEIINTGLSGVSAFADVISYIRLFAVGLASLEIAKSFNGMAAGIMEGGGGGIAAGILILALGHTLNLVMGALSVIVHGIRLKMLEFSSHLGNEWAGYEYKPFKNETL